MKNTLPRLSEYVKLIESQSFTETEKYAIIEWQNKCMAFDNILNYTNFITQQLNISHFVPAVMKDGVWFVLEEANPELETIMYCEKYEEYQNALDNVIFKGFYTYHDGYEDLQGITNGHERFVFDQDSSCFNSNDLDEQIQTIEDLIPYNLEITDKIAEKFKL